MENPGFEIIGTTADTGLLVKGRTYQELFTNAFKGFVSLILVQNKGEDRGNPVEKIEFVFEGDSYENLLVKFLSELLFYLEVKDKMPLKIKILDLFKNRMKLLAEFTDSKDCEVNPVKAVTYHGLNIQKGPDNLYSARIIFDV